MCCVCGWRGVDVGIVDHIRKGKIFNQLSNKAHRLPLAKSIIFHIGVLKMIQPSLKQCAPPSG